MSVAPPLRPPGSLQAAGPDAWRGVTSEDVDEIPAAVGRHLRRRSSELLRELLWPYRLPVAAAALLIGARTAAQLAVPFLVGQAIDAGLRSAGGRGDQRALVTYSVLLAVAVLVLGGSSYGFQRLTGHTGQAVLFDLRLRLFTHIQSLGISFYERYTSGRVIARLTSDIDALSELLQSALASLLTSVLSLIAIAVILLRLDWRLGLITLLAFPAVVALTQWFRSNSQRAYRAVRRAIALVIVHYVESLNGIRAVHAFRREPRNQAIFEDVNGRYRDANTWSNRLAATFAPGVQGLGRLTTAVVLIYGAVLVVQGSATVGLLAAFILYVRQFFEPMQELSQFYNLVQAAGAALEKLAGVLEESPSVPAPARPASPVAVRGEIVFDRVRFAYRDDPVIPGLDLTIPAGQVVALVGTTGAGKTTTARLVSRFYDPQEGSVRLDGVDLRELDLALLRRNVVMVTQESFLFTGTVAGNIAFGRRDATAGDVVEAARAVGAHEFISRLPNGYETDVRRRGVRLSAGQRQLVAFARAFLSDPRVLILDEATSSLDIPTERLVQHALRTLLAGRTAIVIAHRLSTVEVADRVLVMEAGRVVEDGSPAELRRSGGRYAALHEQWVASLA